MVEPTPKRARRDATPAVVAYHYPCADGVFGALAASLGLAPREVRYVPMTVYGAAAARLAVAETLGPDDTLFVVDFFGGQEFVRAACARAKAVVILDHHKTAAEELAAMDAAAPRPANLEVVMDMERSGATIARDYFGLGDRLSPEQTKLFALIEDNDLWRHKLPGSKQFAAGMKDLGLELDVNKNPAIFDTLAALKVANVVGRGAAALAEVDRVVALESGLAFVVKVPHPTRSTALRCLAVKTKFPENRSTLGHVVATRSQAAGLDPVGAVIYTEAAMGDASATQYKVSLRSTGGFDVSVVAKGLGGGGHAGAASCCVPVAAVDGWRDDDAFSIRGFADEDLDAVLEACLKTGDAGADASPKFPNHPKLLGMRWAAPYCKLGTELAFVLEDPQGVCGYVLGALDSKLFYEKARGFLQAAARAYPEPPPASKGRWGLEEELAHEIHHPTMYLPDALYAAYPSHLHIDISPRAQGRRLGGKMMGVLLQKLREAGSAGVHLEMAPENARALRFYGKLGFQKLESPAGTLYLGLKLSI